MSYPFNALNRGVYIADNLAFLRRINDESVDLVNIDPPFGKSKTWPAGRFKPPLTQDELDNEMRLLASWGIATPQQAMGAGLEWPPDSPLKGGYSDIWSWEDDIHEEWVENLRTSYPAVHGLIEVTRVAHSDGHAAYLCFMAIRLMEIHRALKPTGNLFLHCDHTANAYLRQLLDVVFGVDNFRNEIIWERAAGRAKGNQYAPRALGVGTDSIFWYAKSQDAVSHRLYSKLTEAEVQKRFPHKDARGRYNTNVPLFRQPSMGARPNLCYEYKGVRNPHPSGWYVSRERLAEMDANGEIIWRDGKRPLRKSYAAEHRGKPMGNLWNDIPNLTSGSELTGYPTQKPAALAERIIQASTNEGDIVLDCFAGCAYTAIAAERLNRQWTAVDWNPRAWTVFKRQFNKPRLALLTCHDMTTGQQVLGSEPIVTVHGPEQLPKLQSPVREEQLKPLSLPVRRYKERALMSSDEMLEELLRLSGWMAWCCGFANRRPDGKVVETTRNFHLDHIDPVSQGGINDLMNRAPMCPYHNIRKSDSLVSLREYRNQIADAGELMVNSFSELIDLGQAQVQTAQIYARYLVLRRPQDFPQQPMQPSAATL